MKRINTNDYVWVRLNERGWEVFEEHYRNLGLDVETWKGFVTTEGSDWQKFQMYDLMNIFGPVMMLGYRVPFEDNEIRMDDPR